jgi:predicted glycogen debranching enzyme
LNLSSDILTNRDRALRLEWLLTDGAGGYASSTVLGCGTRRYHGLWVPALRPPVARHVVLSHMEERLVADGRETFLNTTEYGDGFFPDASACARTFAAHPLPRLVSEADGVAVEREVLLLPDGGGVCLSYRMHAARPWTLAVAPMLSLRPIHSLDTQTQAFRCERLGGAAGFKVLSQRLPAVFLWTDAGGVETEVSPTWYYGVLRRVERERGFDHFEDVLMPGRWTFRGGGDAAWHVFCSFDPPSRIDAGAARRRHTDRQADLIRLAGAQHDDRVARLVCAADQFLVRRRVGAEDLATVIAGYPWFGDWGRDTFIALPGLAVETGRPDVAEKVLRAFAGAVSQGMTPNRFREETGEPEYNTVDASLWFIQAVAAWARAGPGMGADDAALRRLWPACRDIVNHYRRGTRFGIRADADGLILAGSVDTQLTWMDAQTRAGPVTPRFGKPVEIAALWISALALVKELAERLGEPPPEAVAVLPRARKAFEPLFWNDETGCLFDCVLPDGTRDAAIRPNQIFAVSLPHAPLAGQRAKSVVRTVCAKLMTPRGLRTLASSDPAYKRRYEGGPDERDGAYHQGTVWPWLLGPYVDAVLKTECESCARAEASQILDGLLDATEEAGLGTISEVFDGDAPHRPGGCIAQAWSVAAAIHVWKCLEAAGGPP